MHALHMQELEAEVADLQAQIASLRESVEAETLSKVDLQNNIQSLKEELAFRKKIYDEVRTHWRRVGMEDTLEEGRGGGHTGGG